MFIMERKGDVSLLKMEFMTLLFGWQKTYTFTIAKYADASVRTENNDSTPANSICPINEKPQP